MKYLKILTHQLGIYSNGCFQSHVDVHFDQIMLFLSWDFYEYLDQLDQWKVQKCEKPSGLYTLHQESKVKVKEIQQKKFK